MPEFFYLLINYPTLIAAPIIFFAALALWSHSRTAWVTTVARVVYLVYELGMNAGVFCSGDGCIKRSPLYVVYPLLAFLSLRNRNRSESSLGLRSKLLKDSTAV